MAAARDASRKVAGAAVELRGADMGILDGGVQEQVAQLSGQERLQLEQALFPRWQSANWKLHLENRTVARWLPDREMPRDCGWKNVDRVLKQI